MIRFIDLRGQGTCNRFAFWNTRVDQFVDLGNRDQAWTTRKDFLECSGLLEDDFRDRLLGLMPDWVDTEPTDAELLFPEDE